MNIFYKNLPNNLTKLRLYAVPFLVFFVFFFNVSIASRFIATVLFIAIAFTDYFDGYFARKFKVESDFGKCFDNIADKILVIAMMFVLVWQKRADVLPCIAIAIREVVVSGIREFLSEKQIKVEVSKLAKWKTTLQLIAIGVLIAASQDSSLSNLGSLILWISAAASIITMQSYIKNISDKL